MSERKVWQQTTVPALDSPSRNLQCIAHVLIVKIQKLGTMKYLWNVILLPVKSQSRMTKLKITFLTGVISWQMSLEESNITDFYDRRRFFSRENRVDSRVFSPAPGYYPHPCKQQTVMIILLFCGLISPLIGCCTFGNVQIKSKCSRFLDSHSKGKICASVLGFSVCYQDFSFYNSSSFIHQLGYAIQIILLWHFLFYQPLTRFFF